MKDFADMQKILSNIVKIKVPEAILQQSDKKAKEDMERARLNGLTPHFQTNELENKTIGNIGEFVMAKWLDKHKIHYRMNIVSGKADDYDFKIKAKKWDIKTAKLKYKFSEINPGFHFLINENQADKKIHYYFFNSYRENYLYLIGFINSEFIKDSGLYKTDSMRTFSYKIHLKDLVPPRCMLNLVDPDRMD